MTRLDPGKIRFPALETQDPLEDWQFNPSQLEALDLGSHVAVTAAAGSGKTTLLVERFVRLLEKSGHRPEQIVAITFTEEAASQMRQKIRAALRRRAAASGLSHSAAPESWRQVEQRLGASHITTIHGFCLSLLREFSSEAGLEPSFRVLSGGEQEAMLRFSVEQCLSRLSRGAGRPLRTLLEYRSAFSIRQVLRELVGHRYSLGRIQLGPESQQRLFRAYRRETAGFLSRSPEVLSLRKLLALIPTYLLALDGTCAQRCRQQQALFSRRDRLSPEAFMEQLQDSLSASVQPTRHWLRWPHYPALRKAWDELRRAWKRRPLDLTPASPEEDRHYLRAVRALHSLYEEATEEYQRRRDQAGALDFDDLLERACRLLRTARVKRILRERHPYLLVDEFQDTNWTQWRLLRSLIGPGSNFLAVGDAKQSIYRFRDADVSIFGRVQHWMRSRGKVVEMPENYRASPQLVQFTNQVFRRLFEPLFDYEAAHQEMKPLRGETQGVPRAVQACLFERAPRPEPELAAAWIRHLLASEGVPPGEVALLLRARTRLKDYEAALRRLDVPFQTVGGSGFFQRQEVYDLIALVQFLSNPDHDVALVGLLRSPFFSLSDDEIFEVSRQSGGSFWEKLQGAANAPPERPHWTDCVQLLERWLTRSGVEPLALELSRCLREGGYWETVSISRQGRRISANLEKFLDLALDFEQHGRASPRRFAGLLESLTAAASSEPEGGAEPKSDRVRIYTIHGAKGLEFPVVLLAELGTPFAAAPSGQFYTHTLQGQHAAHSCFGLKIRNPDQRYQEMDHPVYQATRSLNEYRQLAEEKRLLYVALTRARDRLLLLGRTDGGSSFAQWLRQCGAEACLVPGEEMESWLHETVAGPLEPAPLGEPPAHSDEPAPEAGPPAVPALRLEPPKETWTPTEIVNFHRCPRKFLLAHLQAEGEAGGLPIHPLGEQPEVVGTAIHDLLDRFALRLDSPLLGPEIERWSRRLSAQFGSDSQVFSRLLHRHWSNFRTSQLAREMAVALEIHSERTFTSGWQNAVLHGKIDKLFREPGEGWVVVDFKTNPAPMGAPAPADHRSQVELYLWAVSRIVASERVRGTLFYTSSGEAVGVDWNEEARQRCQALLGGLPSSLALEFYPMTRFPEICSGCGFLRRKLCVPTHLRSQPSALGKCGVEGRA